MAKSNEVIVKEINKMFPPANEKYPVCFIRNGEDQVVVTGECYAKVTVEGEQFETAIIDYYGEFTGGYPNIDTKLTEYAEKLGGYWEWENPACICLNKGD